jgi:signal transduction histidine kinase
VKPTLLADRWRAGKTMLLRAAGPPPRPSRPAEIADAALGIVLAAATLNYTLKASHGPIGVKPGPLPPIPGFAPEGLPTTASVGPLQVILAIGSGLALAFRRRYPLATFWVVLFATLLLHVRVQDSDTALLTFASCLIAAYSAAMYSPYRVAAITSLVIGAALIGVRHDTTVPQVTAGYVPFLIIIGIGLAANTAHTWKQRLASVQAEQETATRQAVEHERARIARELHDVVTHNVAVMVVQAGAARKVIDVSPDKARESLLAVEAGGRAAMAELRHVMGLLTMSGDGPEPGDLVPQPGLDQLPELAGRVRATGVPVELTVTGTPAPLPAGVDLAAYRVVQEALTNTVKHAPGARIQINVDYGPASLLVEVADTGATSTPPEVSGNGRGLMGLRERLALYGGSLQSGIRPTGGYRVSATIPVTRP